MKKNAPENQAHLALHKKKELELPVLPLRDVVIFPGTEETLLIGRKNSKSAVKNGLESGGFIFALTQQDPTIDTPQWNDLYKVGTIISIKKIEELNDSTFKATVVAQERGQINSLSPKGTAKVSIKSVTFETAGTPELPAFFAELKNAFNSASGQKSPHLSKKLSALFKEQNAPGLLKEMCRIHKLNTAKRQELLEINSVEERFAAIILFLNSSILTSDLKHSISEKVRKRFETAQKELLLNEQLKEIKKELGRVSDEKNETEELSAKARNVQFTPEAKKKVDKELKRLADIPIFSPEAGVIKGYLDWMVELPWNILKEEEPNISNVAASLNKSHFGLTDVKERILEFVAVNKLAKNNSKGSILCLTGPPGTGKTTLAMSIATALKRDFVRASLGGLRDEAEIRGHRRTYVGSMPGRIIQNIKKAGSSNPVFLLDEIDKMGMDHRGDPASALLEVLDPEINASFQDNYLEVDFNLSKVFFITTSNAIHTIPQPLRDRMEVIHISGYTQKEKLQIAKNFILPKLLKQSGISSKQLQIAAPVITTIIEEYTREAGVRNLERQLQKICRKIAYKILTDEKGPFRITAANINEYIGPPLFRNTTHKKNKTVGLAKGLAWTEAGGQVLDVEARCLPGKGNFTLTGQIGKVMQESGQTALSFARQLLTEEKAEFNKLDIHVHVPDGAIPKDGPSAGITMGVAIISALFQIPADTNFAMTGEISLLGNVLPIGGLKEKILAAKRNGLKKLIIPKSNEHNLLELDAEITKGLSINYVNYMQEVIDLVLPSIIKGKK